MIGLIKIVISVKNCSLISKWLTKFKDCTPKKILIHSMPPVSQMNLFSTKTSWCLETRKIWLKKAWTWSLESSQIQYRVKILAFSSKTLKGGIWSPMANKLGYPFLHPQKYSKRLQCNIEPFSTLICPTSALWVKCWSRGAYFLCRTRAQQTTKRTTLRSCIGAFWWTCLGREEVALLATQNWMSAQTGDANIKRIGKRVKICIKWLGVQVWFWWRSKLLTSAIRSVHLWLAVSRLTSGATTLKKSKESPRAKFNFMSTIKVRSIKSEEGPSRLIRINSWILRPLKLDELQILEAHPRITSPIVIIWAARNHSLSLIR